jgi:hypothetical protein
MKRFVYALAVSAAAPSAALLLLAVGQFVLGIPHADTVASALNLLGIAYPVAIILGIPAHLLLVRMRWTSLYAYLFAGIWIGAGGWCAMVLPFDLPTLAIWPLLLLWGVAGMACAGLFWWLAGLGHRDDASGHT